MLKVGVFGAGHLGKIHIKVIAASPKLELIGYYDPNLDLAQSSDLLKKHKAFQSPEELIHAVDIVDIVSTPKPTFQSLKKPLKRENTFLSKSR